MSKPDSHTQQSFKLLDPIHMEILVLLPSHIIDPQQQLFNTLGFANETVYITQVQEKLNLHISRWYLSLGLYRIYFTSLNSQTEQSPIFRSQMCSRSSSINSTKQWCLKSLIPHSQTRRQNSLLSSGLRFATISVLQTAQAIDAQHWSFHTIGLVDRSVYLLQILDLKQFSHCREHRLLTLKISHSTSWDI